MQAAPHARIVAAGRWRRDRVGPLDGVAALIQGAPRRPGPCLTDGAEAALVGLGVGGRIDPERVDARAVIGLHRRWAPGGRGDAGRVVGGERLGGGVRDVPRRGVERGRAGSGGGVVAEDSRVGRVLPVGEGAAAARVEVGRLHPLVLAGHDEALGVAAGLSGALVAAEVVHAPPALLGESDLVGDVFDRSVGARFLGEQAPVVERVGEPGGLQEVGEAVGLVGPRRVADLVAMALGGLRRLVDLPVLRPRRGALDQLVEVVRVAAGRIDLVQEGHPLLDGDFQLPDPVLVVDPANRLATGGGLRSVGARLVDRVRERDHGHRSVPGRPDLDGPDGHGMGSATSTPQAAHPLHRHLGGDPRVSARRASSPSPSRWRRRRPPARGQEPGADSPVTSATSGWEASSPTRARLPTSVTEMTSARRDG